MYTELKGGRGKKRKINLQDIKDKKKRKINVKTPTKKTKKGINNIAYNVKDADGEIKVLNVKHYNCNGKLKLRYHVEWIQFIELANYDDDDWINGFTLFLNHNNSCYINAIIQLLLRITKNKK